MSKKLLLVFLVVGMAMLNCVGCGSLFTEKSEIVMMEGVVTDMKPICEFSLND